MELALLDGKPFTILLISTAAAGEEEMAVFPGICRLDENGEPYVDRGKRPRFDILPEWIERIRPVIPAARQILRGADYYLPLTVASAENEDATTMHATGLKWPG